MPPVQRAAKGTDANTSRWWNGTLFVVLSISCLCLIGGPAVAPVTPALMQHFQLDSDASFGLIASSFALGRFCTSSLWPIASDFMGRRRVLFMAMVGSAVTTFLQSLVVWLDGPFSVFLLARGLSGIFSGVVPVLKACIVDNFPAEEVPKVLAYREAASTFSFVIGPFIGGALAAWHIALPLDFAAASAALAAVIVVCGIPAGSRNAKSGRRLGAGARSQGRRAYGTAAMVAANVAPLLLLSFVWSCTRTCFHAYYPLMMSRRYALSAMHLGTAMTGVSLLIVCVQICGFEPVRHRLGLRATLALGGLMVALGLAGLGSAPPGMSLSLFMTFSGLYGVGVALLSPAMPALLVRGAPPSQCGMLLGIDSLVVNSGRIVAPPIFGLLYRHGASQAMGIATFIATMVVWHFARKCGYREMPDVASRRPANA